MRQVGCYHYCSSKREYINFIRGYMPYPDSILRRFSRAQLHKLRLKVIEQHEEKDLNRKGVLDAIIQHV